MDHYKTNAKWVTIEEALEMPMAHNSKSYIKLEFERYHK